MLRHNVVSKCYNLDTMPCALHYPLALPGAARAATNRLHCTYSAGFRRQLSYVRSSSKYEATTAQVRSVKASTSSSTVGAGHCMAPGHADLIAHMRIHAIDSLLMMLDPVVHSVCSLERFACSMLAHQPDQPANWTSCLCTCQEQMAPASPSFHS